MKTNEELTFLGDLYGVRIFAETKDDVILQAINKWLLNAYPDELFTPTKTDKQ